MNKISNELKEKIHIWAEGSEELEEVLLNCYKNDLKTIACCKGHIEKTSNPYVAIYINYEKLKLIKELCLYTQLNNNGVTVFNCDKNNIKIIALHNPDFKTLIKVFNNFEKKKKAENSLHLDFAKKIYQLILDNLHSDNSLIYIIKKDNQNNLILEFEYYESEENYNKFFKSQDERISTLPNIILNKKEFIHNDIKYFLIHHKFLFTDFKKMYNYIYTHQNIIFNNTLN